MIVFVVVVAVLIVGALVWARRTDRRSARRTRDVQVEPYKQNGSSAPYLHGRF